MASRTGAGGGCFLRVNKGQEQEHDDHEDTQQDLIHDYAISRLSKPHQHLTGLAMKILRLWFGTRIAPVR